MAPNEPTPAVDSTTGHAREFEAQVIAQAVQDPAFRDRLLADPKAVLAEQGLSIPPEVKIQALQETADQYYLVLPAGAQTGGRAGASLSDAQLEAVAGGYGGGDAYYTGDRQDTGCAMPGVGCGDTSQLGWTGCGSDQSGCVASYGCADIP